MENTKNTNDIKKGSWFKNLQAEFERIIWPTTERTAKESTLVIVCTIIIAIVIAVLDMGLQYGIKALVG